MSKTVLKKDNKPYVTVKTAETEKLSEYTEFHQTHSVKHKLIDEQDALWGLEVESGGIKKKIPSDVVHTMIVVYHVPFVVDWSGKDKPATLTIVHKKTPDGMHWFFKTIGDRYIKNNFASIPELKSQSSHLRGRVKVIQ